MKLALVLVMCSNLHSVCLPPVETGLTFSTWKECSIKGYEESLDLMKNSDPKNVNEAELFVKFYCYDKLIEEDT